MEAFSPVHPSCKSRKPVVICVVLRVWSRGPSPTARNYMSMSCHGSFSDCPNRRFGSRLWCDRIASLPKPSRGTPITLCLPCATIALSLARVSVSVAAGALKRRSYCHNEERRIIPHRLVHHWDFTLHRVCKDAAVFLDATRSVPLINLPVECPRIFVEHQVCENNKRPRRCQTLHHLCIDKPSTNVNTHAAFVELRQLCVFLCVCVNPALCRRTILDVGGNGGKRLREYHRRDM